MRSADAQSSTFHLVDVVVGGLGGVWVADPDHALIRPRSKIQAGLLALLMIEPGRTVTFESACDALWPGQDLVQNRHSLRVHMSNLRKWVRATAGDEIAQRLETRPTGYSLAAHPEQVDVTVFAALIADAQVQLASGEANDAIATFRSALAMWDTPFPELADHPESAVALTRLELLHELSEDELITARLRAGHGGDMIGDLTIRSSQHPHRELPQQQLMIALYGVGRQTDALQVYHDTATRLVEDLGLDPGPQLRETHLAILNQNLHVARQPSMHVPLPLVDGSPFAGRTDEINIGMAAIERGDILVILGEPGAGKTRLVQQLRAERTAAMPQTNWVFASMRRDKAAPPLRQLLNAMGADTDVTLDDQSELFIRNEELVVQLTRTPDTVLVIDDFQWADESTVDFVRHATASKHRSFPIVLSLRSADVDLHTPAGQLAVALAPRADSTRIDIEALEIEAVAELAKQANSTVDPAALLERSGGNALFVRELLRSGFSSGTSSNVPEGVAALVDERLSDSDDAVHTVLATAALITTPIEIELLIRVADVSVDDTMRALDVGRELGLIVSGDDGELLISHALIADSLSTRLGEVAQRRVHLRIAEALERRPVTTHTDDARLAHHAMEAFPLGDARRAFEISVKAGHGAAGQLAYTQARKHFHDAMRAADLLDDAHRTEHLPTLFSNLGRAEIRSGDFDAGNERLRHATALARQAGDAALFARSVRWMCEGRSTAPLDLDDLRPLIEEAVELVQDHVSEDRVFLLGRLATLRYFTDDLVHRREIAQQGIELAFELDQDRSKALAYSNMCMAITAPQTAHERLEHAQTSIRYAERCGWREQTIIARVTSICGLLETGDISGADHALRRLVERLEGLDAGRLAWLATGWQVLQDIRAGEFEIAEQRAAEALVMWGNGEHPDCISAFGGQLATIRLLQGNGADVVAMIDGAFDADLNQIAYQTFHTYALTLTNDRRAPAAVRQLLDDVEAARDDVMLGPSLAATAEAIALAVDSGLVDDHGASPVDPAAAQRLADRIEPFAGLHAVVNVFGTGGFYWGSLQHAHGLALRCAGRTHEAQDALDRAIAEHRRIGSVMFEARSVTARDRLS